jgi:hypothetical protein
MANFDTSQAKRESVRNANNLLDFIQHIYQSSKATQQLLTLYTAGTDPTFNAAVNALYSTAERAELGAMLTDITTLLTSWEANHKAPLGLP